MLSVYYHLIKVPNMPFHPSDITQKQFKKSSQFLNHQESKHIVELYEVFCGILYVLKSGCQWRMLPKDFPKWSTCYYFTVWNEKKDEKSHSPLDEVLKKMVTELRILDGRKEKTRFIIRDDWYCCY